MIVVYASKWAVYAALLQEPEGTYWINTLLSRSLNSSSFNKIMLEKELNSYPNLNIFIHADFMQDNGTRGY